MSKAIAIALGPDEILALSTLERMPHEEADKIEQMAETIAIAKGCAVVDAIVLLMKIGQMFSQTDERVLRHGKETR